ncbi:hypothetical protein Cni_G26993 [Canna indica]|uniref:Uncharacterized protein n=1 Tax=Canna indica TaxID=4628 RepID=A0AAQ3L0T1_9LILI|nr:hypothetical protein Cni_G26993 [Canna indica]
MLKCRSSWWGKRATMSEPGIRRVACPPSYKKTDEDAAQNISAMESGIRQLAAIDGIMRSGRGGGLYEETRRRKHNQRNLRAGTRTTGSGMITTYPRACLERALQAINSLAADLQHGSAAAAVISSPGSTSVHKAE